MKSPRMGMNRTGIATAPRMGKELQEVTELTEPSSPGNAASLAEFRAIYADGDVLGTVSPPVTVKGMARAALLAMKGERATVLFDKLSERVAFERTGTRLYEALISKHDAYGSWHGGPTRGELSRIRDEELDHFDLLCNTVQELGGDPTMESPSADLAAVASRGIVEIIADPRTDLRQGLEAILIAELTDNAQWENLARLVEGMGHEKVSHHFRMAIHEEHGHLAMVSGWLSRAMEVTSGAELRIRPMASARTTVPDRTEERPGRERKTKSRTTTRSTTTRRGNSRRTNR